MSESTARTHDVALVTGGTSGIGLAIVRALADDGHPVAFCGRDGTRVAVTESELRAEGLECRGHVCDVRDRAAVETFVDAVVDEMGEPRILVNNAGRGGGGRTAELDDDTWIDVLDANLNGTFWVTRAVLRRTRPAEGGRIVMIASTGGKQGVPLGAPYSASKAGVIGFAKALAKELAPTGTTVNAVCPGYVETPMAEQIREHYARLEDVSTDEILRRFRAKVPMGRYSTADEVAAMVRYLCSDGAASVTAQALNVCGGLGSY